ncbi:hypothetical protein ABT009_16895 [Streptomyces sp. NPDC002896]|uniref:hypothetical protein n=1 Tax=Streptomyces sp. NPDC002896 TaxID=3154438 RepID=UPI00331F9DD5
MPEPAPSGGPSRLLLALVIGGAVVVLGIVVLLVALLRGGGGGGSAGESVSPSPRDSASEAAAARNLADRVTLTTADWGPGFVRSDPYESTSLNELTVKDTCELADRKARPGTLAVLTRTSVNNDDGLTAVSETRAYADQPAAEKFVADTQDSLHRCSTQTYGKVRWEDVREAVAPDVNGFDELVSEESRQVTYDDGSKADLIYISVMGRTGDTVLNTWVAGPPDSESKLRKLVTDGLQLMRQRLTSAGATAPYTSPTATYR